MLKLVVLLAVTFALAVACDGDGSASVAEPTAADEQTVASPASNVPALSVAPTAAATEIPEPPEINSSANVQTGEDWTIKTRVANLDKLDLAIGVYWNDMTFIDVASGRGVATADFAGNVYVRIREHPRQLIVSHSGDGGYRMLIFDVLDRGFALKHELALPQRYGHQVFTNAMHLSNDGRYAYFGERDFIDRPECDVESYDGVACLRYSIRVIDLDDPADYKRLEMPERCYPQITPYGERSVAAFCSGSPGTLVIAPYGDAQSVIGGYELIPQLSVEGWPDYAGGEYATVLGDGSPRVLYGDGSVRSTPGDTPASVIVAPPVLSPGHTSYGVEKIDDARVLLSSGERRAGGAPTSHVRVFNLASGKVETALPAPSGTLHATVLDEQRGVVLTKDGERYAMQIFDLTSGALAAPMELTGLGGGPEIIVR